MEELPSRDRSNTQNSNESVHLWLAGTSFLQIVDTLKAATESYKNLKKLFTCVAFYAL